MWRQHDPRNRQDRARPERSPDTLERALNRWLLNRQWRRERDLEERRYWMLRGFLG